MTKLRWLMAVLAMPAIAGWSGADEPSKLQLGEKPAAVSNQELANQLVQSLEASGQLQQYVLDVETQDGVVTLHGSVADEAQRQAAISLVKAATGVREVKDVITVRGSGVLPTGLEAPGAAPAIVTEPAPVTEFAGGIAPYADAPVLPPYSWPAYTPYNNYASMAYQTQYPAGAWPFIGPPHPYPMIPSGWRKVTLKWQKGYWWLKFHAH